jgi:hypothetical protein
MYQRQSRFALAETYAAQALAGRQHALGPEHPETLDSADDLALAYESQGKFAESELLTRPGGDTVWKLPLLSKKPRVSPCDVV